MSTASTAKSRHLVTSSNSETSSTSSDEETDAGRHRSTAAKPAAASVSKSRVITSSSDSDDSSDDDESVTLLKNRAAPDKSRKITTSTPLPRQSIYTSSDNDDDSDSDSIGGTPLKKSKPSLSTPSGPKQQQSKKPVQSATKKQPKSTPSSSSKVVSKPSVHRESSADSDATVAAKSSKPSAKDAKRPGKISDRDVRAESVPASVGQTLKKEVKKPPKSGAEQPIPRPRASSFFGDVLAKSAQMKVASKPGMTARADKPVRKDLPSSAHTDTHKSTSVSAKPNKTLSHADVEATKSKHSISEGNRHSAKPSSGTVEKKSGSERPSKSVYNVARDSSGRKLSETESPNLKKVKLHEQSSEGCNAPEAESDESPVIRAGNIFEKMEKQDCGPDKGEEARKFGHADAGVARRHSRASEIAVFVPESDDDDDREPVVESARRSIERLKEESAKEETIEEAVKAIIEFTKEPSTPPHSSSKATDSSEPLEDTSAETVDDDVGLSDDGGELNAAIGNLIEKELEPVGGDVSSSDKTLESDASVTSPHYHRSSGHGGLAEPKNELLPSFAGTGFKEEHGAMKMEVERHIRTSSAHDEQNVTSFMSRLEKATADSVDFAAISAAAAANRKLTEKVGSGEVTSPGSRPDQLSSRLFAGAIGSTPVKPEPEKPVTVKKEECPEQAADAVKPEPVEFPPSTKIFSSPKHQPEIPAGGGCAAAAGTEKAVAPASTEQTGEDSSTTADLYEFKDDDDDEAASCRQKDFVLHKRSRKRHAETESTDAGDVADSKKSRGSHAKSDQPEPSLTAEQCPAGSSASVSSDSQPVSTMQSSWRTNMDLVIDAVARGEFERGDDFNYYTTQNSTAMSSTTKGRRGRGASREDQTHKPVPASTAPGGPLSSSLPTLPAGPPSSVVDAAFGPGVQRSLSVAAVGTSAQMAGRSSPKLLLSGLPSPQQLQQFHRMYAPGSHSASFDLCLCLSEPITAIYPYITPTLLVGR